MRGTHPLLLLLCLWASSAGAQPGPSGSAGPDVQGAARPEAEVAHDTEPDADIAAATGPANGHEPARIEVDVALTAEEVSSPDGGAEAEVVPRSGAGEGPTPPPLAASPKMVDFSRPPPDLPSRMPPYLTMVVGALSTAVGLALGVIPALNCSGRCRPNGLAGGFVVVGVSVGTVGGVWLYDVNTERRALITQHKLSDPRGLLAAKALQLRF